MSRVRRVSPGPETEFAASKEPETLMFPEKHIAEEMYKYILQHKVPLEFNIPKRTFLVINWAIIPSVDHLGPPAPVVVMFLLFPCLYP